MPVGFGLRNKILGRNSSFSHDSRERNFEENEKHNDSDRKSGGQIQGVAQRGEPRLSPLCPREKTLTRSLETRRLAKISNTPSR